MRADLCSPSNKSRLTCPSPVSLCVNDPVSEMTHAFDFSGHAFAQRRSSSARSQGLAVPWITGPACAVLSPRLSSRRQRPSIPRPTLVPACLVHSSVRLLAMPPLLPVTPCAHTLAAAGATGQVSPHRHATRFRRAMRPTASPRYTSCRAGIGPLESPSLPSSRTEHPRPAAAARASPCARRWADP
jgi:hypothetical protein